MSARALALVTITDCTISFKNSWQNGTKAQALIEFAYPDYSPFSINFGNFSTDPHLADSVPDEIIAIAQTTLENRPLPVNARLFDKTIEMAPLLKDESAGDPASLGIAVLLAGVSNKAKSKKIKDVGYYDAAYSQILYVLNEVHMNHTTGAISHREGYSQAWGESSDDHGFCSSFPPDADVLCVSQLTLCSWLHLSWRTLAT